MNGLTFAPDLVEESVLLAEQSMMGRDDARAFRRERDRIYTLTDDREREDCFRSLHLRYFSGLGLGAAVADVLGERSEVTSRVNACRIVRAIGARDESADLVDALIAGRSHGIPTVIIRLCPSTLVGPQERLRALLHHELTHVADMLNPSFGYQRDLPPSDDGPSADNILRDRYRVLWDTTIDGRLTRAGRAGDEARASRWLEFAATFGMLNEECQTAFERWFDELHATHDEILAFALSPSASGATNVRDSSRCPLCRFPVAALDPRGTTLADETVEMIRSEQPAWSPDQGLCSQCLDLYEARHHEERHAAQCEPPQSVAGADAEAVAARERPVSGGDRGLRPAPRGM